MQDLIINADDYGMDAGVDGAILELAGRGIVTAASAMVLSPRWPEASRALRDAPLSRGLHLDLTSSFASDSLRRPQRLFYLIVRSEAGLIDRQEIFPAIERQLHLFSHQMGDPPDFIDGHQHVHHLPTVREALLDAVAQSYGSAAARIGLRICLPRRWQGIKAAIIARTGAIGLAKLAAARGHPANTDFRGVYNLSADADLNALWQTWVQGLEGPLPLIMCHVASSLEGDHRTDPIRQARLREYEWLASEAFLAFRQQMSLNPARWPQA